MISAIYRFRLTYRRNNLDAQYVSFGVSASSLESAIEAVENKYILRNMELIEYEIMYNVDQDVSILGGSITPVKKY